MSVIKSDYFTLKISQTQRKLHSFVKLQDGWSYGVGVRFDPSLIKKVSKLLFFATSWNIPKIDVFPIEDGSIGVGLVSGKHSLEATVYPDFRTDFCLELEDEELLNEESKPYTELRDAVVNLAKYSSASLDDRAPSSIEVETCLNKNLSESSTQLNGGQTNRDFVPMHLKTTEMEYPSSVTHVVD